MNKTSLVEYSEKNDVGTLREILEAGVDINQYACERSALHASCVSNAVDAAELLINNGIDVNLRDNLTGATALHYCSVYNYFEIAKMIIDHGGRLDIADNYGNQPLWTAVFNVKGKQERFPLVEMYLMHGSDKNHKNNANRSPLDFAMQIKHKPLIDLLDRY
jgi:uncharacterized protein